MVYVCAAEYERARVHDNNATHICMHLTSSLSSRIIIIVVAAAAVAAAVVAVAFARTLPKQVRNELSAPGWQKPQAGISRTRLA